MKRLAVIAAVLLAACATQGPARNDDLFAKIRPGMTEEEVRRIAGPPDETMPFPMLRQNSWGYHYFESWGYYALFSATFGPDGRVVSTFVRRLSDGRDQGT